MEGRGIHWVIYSLTDKRIVGSCGFKNIDKDLQQGEFGIILHRMVWGKGHAIESHLLCLKYGFEIMKLRRIYFNTDVCNKRMQRFFEKIGIRYVGEAGEGYPRYEILQSEWTSVFGKLEEILTKKVLYTGSTS